jgi:radical SAM superfamily enzyme YgiQ (UPF0313 family)
MKYTLTPKKKYLLRIIVPAYPRFNIYSFIANKTTTLGPIYIATSANELREWNVEIIDENNFYNLGSIRGSRGVNHELIQKQRPADVVGFYGGLTSTIPRIYKLAEFYKQKGIITIAGGQHFVDETIPEALSSSIDCVVRGEGEVTIKELLYAFSKGDDLSSVAGIAYKNKGEIISTSLRPSIQNLDMLPLPDFSLIKYARIKLFPVGRVRGCVMNCEFCAVKGKPRYASSERLLEQISKLIENRGARDFFIVDDLFGQDRNETFKLCNMLIEYQKRIGVRLRFTVQIRLDKARDTELLKVMRDANINVVTIGFESPIEEELKAMNKSLRPKEMGELTEIFHRFGFFIHGMFIFGYPMKDDYSFVMSVKERVRHFKSFIKKTKIDTIQVLLPVPLPGTELRARLIRQERIYPLNLLGWEYYDGTFPLFKLDYPLSFQEMQGAIRKIMSSFYHIRYLFIFLLNILAIFSLPFYFNNIRAGWKMWYRRWRNYAFRIIGQRTIKNWTRQLYKERFFERLL